MGLNLIKQKEFITLEKSNVSNVDKRSNKRQRCCPPECVCREKLTVEQYIGQSMASTETTVNSSTGSNGGTQEVTDFFSDTNESIVSLIPKSIEATYVTNDYSTSMIQGWLERPRKILTVPWSPGGTGDFLPQQFSPYESYFAGAGSGPLLNKLENYFLVRGNLHVKFIINGSQFHYGLARAAYRPGRFDNNYPPNLNPRQPLTITNYDGITIPEFVPMLTMYSQRRGVFIDPNSNQPAEIIIPYFAVKNYIDLRSQFQDLTALGSITLYCQNILQHAMGATDPVTISVYMYMTESILSTPTETSAFTGQSKSDEYGQGIVSAPANAIAKFAGRLSGVPYISKLAMATQIGANAVSGIAGLWGFSRTVNIERANPIRPRPIGLLANTSGEDTIAKLTLDPKQEITVDPGSVGLPSTDEMSLAHICQTESLLVTRNWSSLDAANARLIAIKVHPMVYPRCATSAPILESHIQTSLAFGTRPFKAWRGSIHYRIQIIRAPSQKGLLLIQYDPNANNFNAIPNMQTRFNQVVDISECSDMTYCVNYNRSEMYLGTDWDTTSLADISTTFSNPFPLENKQTHNGVLIISVLNELAVPLDTASVQINVYIKAGDDYELQNPDSANLNRYSYREPTTFAGGPVGLVGGGGEELEGQSMTSPMTQCQNEPIQCKYHVINGTAEDSVPQDLKKVLYGEQNVSIRPLMKRYCLADIGAPVANVTAVVKEVKYVRPNMPNGPGSAYGNSTPTTTIPAGALYQYPDMNYIRYFMGAYAGYRGSIKWKYMQMHVGGQCLYMVAAREPGFLTAATRCTTQALGIRVLNTESAARTAFTFRNALNDLGSKSGSEMTDYTVNRVVEFEVPWQSEQRFQYCHDELAGSSDPETLAYTDFQKHNHSVTMFYNSDTNVTNSMMMSYVATGEDFSLFYYIGAPIMYSRTPPVPAP